MIEKPEKRKPIIIANSFTSDEVECMPALLQAVADGKLDVAQKLLKSAAGRKAWGKFLRMRDKLRTSLTLR